MVTTSELEESSVDPDSIIFFLIEVLSYQKTVHAQYRKNGQ